MWDKLIEGDNWFRFHDTVFEVTGQSYSKEILMQLFEDLPPSYQYIAQEWGLDDTDFNTLCYEYFKGLMGEED
jgi:hypothetical protein